MNVLVAIRASAQPGDRVAIRFVHPICNAVRDHGAPRAMQSASSDRQPAPPAQIGRYQIVGRLGFGGMASVYDGYDASVNRYAAVKLLHRQFAARPEVVDTFLQEARKVARLERHDGILTVYEVGDHEGTPYIAMQKIDGMSLDALLAQREGVLPCATVRQIFATVGGALGFAHSHGIVHCDIKPSNILVERFGRAFLTDFGISRARPDRLGVAVDGVPACTPRYASPEQLRGATADLRSDIYSLGLVLYEMCTGVTPFADCEDVAELAAAMAEDPPCPPSRLNRYVPEALDRAILRALASAPDDRYQTAADFLRDVLAATDDETPGDVHDGASRPRRHRAVGSRYAVVVALVIALASALAVAVGMVMARPAPSRLVASSHPDPSPSPRAEPVAPPAATRPPAWLADTLAWFAASWQRASARLGSAPLAERKVEAVTKPDLDAALAAAMSKALLGWEALCRSRAVEPGGVSSAPAKPAPEQPRGCAPSTAPPPDFAEIQRRAREMQDAARRSRKR